MPDTPLWTGKMDNGQAIACPIRLYGPGKRITATQLHANIPLWSGQKGHAPSNCVPGNNMLLWTGKNGYLAPVSCAGQ